MSRTKKQSTKAAVRAGDRLNRLAGGERRALQREILNPSHVAIANAYLVASPESAEASTQWRSRGQGE
jgi:hypothetical protein